MKNKGKTKMKSKLRVYIYSTSTPRTECETKSIFNRSITSLIQFSFSKICCLTWAKEPSLPDYLHIYRLFNLYATDRMWNEVNF